jgi:hypothetical protein
MRGIVLLGLLSAAGCAGQPPAEEPRTVYVNASGAALQQVSAAKADGDVDAKRLVNAKKLGFKVINKDGEQLYCRTWDRLGSRVLKDTQCLTADQLDQWHEQTMQAMQEYLRSNCQSCFFTGK